MIEVCINLMYIEEMDGIYIVKKGWEVKVILKVVDILNRCLVLVMIGLINNIIN